MSIPEPEVVEKKTITFEAVAARAGHKPGPDGKLNLPSSDQAAEDLAAAAIAICGGPWHPGMPRLDVTLTGAGPVWAYLKIAHALHGRVVRLVYAAPNATVVIWNHGL